MTRWLYPLACLLLLSACSTRHYRASADREVARIIADKTPAVRNMDTNFTIEATNRVSLATYPIFDKSEESFGVDSALENGARIVSLDHALEIAVHESRTYQTRKEVLFLSALS